MIMSREQHSSYRPKPGLEEKSLSPLSEAEDPRRKGSVITEQQAIEYWRIHDCSRPSLKAAREYTFHGFYGARL